MTGEDLLDHQERLGRDPEFDSALKHLYDMTQADEFEVDPEDVRQLALRNVFGPGSKRAVVVDSDLAYGLTRMYQMLSEESGDVVDVFRSLDEAREWLGLASDPPAPEGEAAAP